MRALVTGATGFVGAHLISSVSPVATSVHVVLRPDDPLDEAPYGTEGHVASLTDQAAMVAVLRAVQPTHIFHLAGASSVADSFRDPAYTWEVNVEGTRCLLSAVATACPLARVVVALSGDQYGRVAPEELPVTEDTPFHPLSPYAESKVAAEGLCTAFRSKSGLAAIRLRAFNQIGPGQDLRFVLPSVCKQIADAEAAGERRCTIRVGDVAVRRDFIDVRDAARAYLLLAQVGDPDRVYLACRGRSVAISDLIDLAVAHATIGIEVRTDPDRRRDGEQADLYADPSALEDLGWRARIPIEQSVLDTLNFWRARAHTEVD